MNAVLFTIYNIRGYSNAVTMCTTTFTLSRRQDNPNRLKTWDQLREAQNRILSKSNLYRLRLKKY